MRKFFCISAAIIFCFLLSKSFAMEQNPKEAITTLNMNVPSNYYSFENQDERYLFSYNVTGYPMTSTFIANDGTISVFVGKPFDDKTIIYEYDSSMKFLRKLTLPRELPLFGAFTRDKEGNYYVLSGQEFKEELPHDSQLISTILAKYDENGNKLMQREFKAYDDFQKLGTKDPFHSSNTILRASDNELALYFGRLFFKTSDGLNHQGSMYRIFNKETFEELYNNDYEINPPFVSHCFEGAIKFDQEENAFISAMIADASPRAIAFARIKRENEKSELLEDPIKECEGMYQETYTKIAGFEKNTNGYIFAGTAERNNITTHRQNDSRNIFIETINNDFTSLGEKKWITNYNRKEMENAGSPKMVAISGGRYLLMWELMGKSYNDVLGGYKGTYMTIIDGAGNLLQDVQKLPDIRLSPFEPLVFNSKNNSVYWSIINSNQEMILYSFNPDEAIPVIDIPVANYYSGLVEEGTKITLSYPDSTAKIYYTLDGTTPTQNSTFYTGPIEIKIALTLKAVAIYEDRSSKICSYQYKPCRQLSMPDVSLPSGTYDWGTEVYISRPNEAVAMCDKIYYTLDGTIPDPVMSNTYETYINTSIKLTQDCKLVIHPVKMGWESRYSMTYDYKVVNHPDYQDIGVGFQDLCTKVLPEHMIGVNGQHSEGYRIKTTPGQTVKVYLTGILGTYDVTLMDKNKNVIKKSIFSQGETINLSNKSSCEQEYYLEVGIYMPEYLADNAYQIGLNLYDSVIYASNDFENLSINNNTLDTSIEYTIAYQDEPNPETITFFALYEAENNRLVAISSIDNKDLRINVMQLNFSNLSAEKYIAKLITFRKNKELEPAVDKILTKIIYPVYNDAH